MKYMLKKGEIPIQAENRFRKALWKRIQRMETLSVSQLVDTIASFAASVVGASYQMKGMSIEANLALKKLKKELKRRYRQQSSGQSSKSSGFSSARVG